MITDLSESALSGTTSTTTTDTSSSNTDMTLEDFVTIMVEELTNQDPTDPTDTSSYVTQLTQLQNMQAVEEQTEAIENVSDQMDDMSDLIYSMTYDSAFQNACSLIGTEVTGVTDDDLDISGTVSSVQVDGEDIYVVLGNGYSIDYYSLTDVGEAS